MQEKLIRVAVYGTLMTGERNEHWGADARRRVPCTIRGVLYDTGWGYPAFVPDEHGRDVAAELLDVTPETLARLDVLEGYPRLYVRETVAATLADGSVVQAMVYVMRKLPEGARAVGSGDWQTEPLERRLAPNPGEAHTSRNPAEDVSVAYLRDRSDHYWTSEIFADEDD